MAVALIKGANGHDNRRVLGPARINAKATTHTMKRNDPAALMRAIWKKHELRYARPHDLRRTAATLVQSAVLPDRPMKWSVEEVGWLLGHRNEKGGPVTLVYARYDHFDEKRAMAATLERELLPGSSGVGGVLLPLSKTTLHFSVCSRGALVIHGTSFRWLHNEFVNLGKGVSPGTRR
jgi:hypothetical protein